MPFAVTTPPNAQPVSLDEAKLHLRVTGNAEDTLITRCIGAATDFAEKFSHLALMPRSGVWYQDDFQQIMRPAVSPVRAVTGIQYIDTNGDTQTLDPSAYIADVISKPARIAFKPNQTLPDTLEIPNAVSIAMDVGFADAASIPDQVKQAMMFLIGHYYANREDVVLDLRVTEIEHSAALLLMQQWTGMLY